MMSHSDNYATQRLDVGDFSMQLLGLVNSNRFRADCGVQESNTLFCCQFAIRSKILELIYLTRPERTTLAELRSY